MDEVFEVCASNAVLRRITFSQRPRLSQPRTRKLASETFDFISFGRQTQTGLELCQVSRIIFHLQ